MTALTTYGVLGDHLWVKRDGDTFPLTLGNLAVMRVHVTNVWGDGTTRFAGHVWDESQVNTLIADYLNGPELDPCVKCRELPILHGGEHCIKCAGLVQDQSDSTMRTWRAS